MRISCDENDEGYKNWSRIYAGHLQVYVNGEVVPRCITVDEKEGIAIRHKIGDDGKPIMNEMRDGFIRETLHGDVRIAVDADRFPELAVLVRGSP